MKKHVLALVLVAMVFSITTQPARACHPLFGVAAMVVTIVGMSVGAAFLDKFLGRDYVKGYSCPEYGRQIHWYCCTANYYGQLSCNDMTVIPCAAGQTPMCYYGNYYGRETWRYASNIYTDDAAQKQAGLTALVVITAVGTVGIALGTAACLC